MDNRDKGIQGISANISGQDKPKVSDDNGTIQFIGVAGGSHTISYTYLGKQYVQLVGAGASTVAPIEAAAPKVITLDQTLNIQAASAVQPAVKSSGDGSGAIAVAIVSFLAIAAAAFVFIRQRRKRAYEAMMDDSPPPPLPEYKPLDPQLPPVVPGQSGAEHMGESLKDLVIRGMKGGGSGR